MAVAAVFLGYFAFERVPLSSILYQWVIFPATRYQDINRSTLGIFAGWEIIGDVWKAGSFRAHPLLLMATTLTEAFVWLSPFAAATVVLANLRGKWMARGEMGLLAAGLAAFLGGCLHRWTLTNLHFALPLPLVLIAWAISRLRGSERTKVAGVGLGLWFACATPSVLFGICYFVRTAPAQTTAVRSAAGTLRTINPIEAKAVQGKVDAVDAMVPPNAPLFIDGYMPLISFLTLHPNPTPFTFFRHPVYNTDEQAREVQSILNKLPVAYVLASLPLRPDSFLSRDYVARYKVLWQNDLAMLLVRVGPARELARPTVPPHELPPKP
jgi:hypothetical protein